jgi:hypothetical protein
LRIRLGISEERSIFGYMLLIAVSKLLIRVSLEIFWLKDKAVLGER